MNGWEADKARSDVFMTRIKETLGRELIWEAPIEEDRERATDLIVLSVDGMRIGCRVRDAKYWGRYPNEFTIRAGRPRGTKTELAKILDGWGDYFFYGFGASYESGQLLAWALGDLAIFREWYQEYQRKNLGRLPGREQKNHDGSSVFHAFLWRDLPASFVKRRGGEMPDYHSAPVFLGTRTEKAADILAQRPPDQASLFDA